MTGLESLAVPVLAGLIGYVLRHVNVFGQGGGAPPLATPVAPAHPVLAELERIVVAAVRDAVAAPAPSSTAVTPTPR